MSQPLERLLSLMVIIALLGVIVWQRQTYHPTSTHSAVRPEAPASSTKVSDSFLPTRTLASDPKVENAALEAAHSKIIRLERQLADLSKPLEADVRSAAVNTAVRHDETLITGGYQTPDGLTHFLFLKPDRHELPDGRIAVKLQGSQFALSPEQLAGSELAGLTTNAGNTLQHGQAWKNDETDRVIAEMRKNDSGDQISAPSVITMPGMQAQVTVDGDFSYSVIPDFLEDGSGFQLRMRMEHVPSEP